MLDIPINSKYIKLKNKRPYNEFIHLIFISNYVYPLQVKFNLKNICLYLIKTYMGKFFSFWKPTTAIKECTQESNLESVCKY